MGGGFRLFEAMGLIGNSDFSKCFVISFFFTGSLLLFSCDHQTRDCLSCRFCFFYSATLPPCIKLKRGGIQDGRLGSGPAFANNWSETMSRSFSLGLTACSWLRGRVGES